MSTSTATRDTVIIGGGQAGLAMSHLLTRRGRDHVVLERQDQIASSWRGRWDSFTLVTPSWTLRLPGHHYDGDDPDGFLTRDEVVAYVEDYAAGFDPPLRLGVTVTGVARDDGPGYLVTTGGTNYRAANVVVAAGTFQEGNVPPAAQGVPDGIAQLHTCDYTNPSALPDGPVLVVGSGQSGCQIARELHESGRRVHLCVGSAARVPRRYRGHDMMWWAIRLGITEQPVHELDSPADRFVANPQATGRNGGEDVNLHAFARDGIRLLGRLRDVRDGAAILGDGLHDSLAAADGAAAEFREGADTYAEENGLELPEEDVDEPRDGFDQPPVRELDLAEAGIRTVVWATGYRWDYSWIDLPVLDEYGYPIQRRGVTDHPGLYFLGLHWLHTLKSGLFLGVGGDAEHVARHIARHGPTPSSPGAA